MPDSWSYEEEGTKCCHHSRRAPKRAPVTDILLWIECYASMAALLVTRYPNKAVELLAYQRTILCAHRDFEGEAWATYDTCYRRQAAARKSLDWSLVDFNLYNQTFAGRARAKKRCRFCLSEYHQALDCYYAPEIPVARSFRAWQEEPIAPQQPPREFPMVYSSSSSRTPSQTQNESIEICTLYNDERGDICRYKKKCKFLHVCINRWCHGSHPASACTVRKLRDRKRSPPHRQLGSISGSRSISTLDGSDTIRFLHEYWQLGSIVLSPPSGRDRPPKYGCGLLLHVCFNNNRVQPLMV